jgi:hypothetical protein
VLTGQHSSLGFLFIRLPEPIFGQLLIWHRERLPCQAYTGDTDNQLEVLAYLAPLSEQESYQLGFDLYPTMQDWYAGTDSLKFSTHTGFGKRQSDRDGFRLIHMCIIFAKESQR